jgi:phosphoglycerate dehydrogenase-like enzyme
MDPVKLLVIANPTASHLRLLERLPEPVNIHVGNDPEFLKKHAPDADVILNAVFGRDLLRCAFVNASKVRWVHSLSAGVDQAMFPELSASPVPMTNGRGVFKEGLSEFAVAAILFFAKDFRRLVRSQEAGRWEQFDVTEVSGQVLGIVGYGEIGRATAQLARGLGMKVIATRRRPERSANDSLIDRIYPLDQLRPMLAASDYVLVCAPLTPETKGMIGEGELAAMKRSAVIINVGRGPVIVEPALIAALERRRIKGAALDVFDTEPLPEGHTLYKLPNVLISPHSADHTVGWEDRAMLRFLQEFEHFRDGRPLENIVDKKAGY